MKKIIKFIKNNTLGFLVGLSLCLNGVIIAENMIPANQVTYNDSTVQTELDSLFDAVNINERLGSTDISSIGDGTISGAIVSQQNEINKQNSELLNTVKKHVSSYYLYNTENNIIEFSTGNPVIMYGARGNYGFLVIFPPHATEYLILQNINNLLTINSHEYNNGTGKHTINFSLGSAVGSGIWISIIG